MAGSLIRVLVVLAVAALPLAAAPAAYAAPQRAQAPPAIALTSQARPVGPLGRQVDFHANLAVDFVVTGAELTGRIVAVPQALVTDIGRGTPAPVAIRRAVLTLADVEFDAGRELVGYARDYADFQIRFVTGLFPVPLRELIAAGSALATQLVHRLADFAITVVDRAQSTLHRALSGPAASPAPTPAEEEPAPLTSRRTVAAPDGDDPNDPVSHSDGAKDDSVATTVRPRRGVRASGATALSTATSRAAEPSTADTEDDKDTAADEDDEDAAPSAGPAPSSDDESADAPAATP